MEDPRFCDTLHFRIFFVRLFASSLCKLAPLRQNTRTTQLALIKSRKPRQVTEPGIFHLQLVMVYRRNLASLWSSWLTCYSASLFWVIQISGIYGLAFLQPSPRSSDFRHFIDSYYNNLPLGHPVQVIFVDSCHDNLLLSHLTSVFSLTFSLVTSLRVILLRLFRGLFLQ